MEAAVSASQPLVEQRRFPRLHVQTAVQFRNILKPNEPFAGSLCRNVSASGLSLMTDGFLPKESRWVLLVSLPRVSREPIRLIGRVVWSMKKMSGRPCEGGIQFIEVAAEDKRMIADFVERGVVPVVS